MIELIKDLEINQMITDMNKLKLQIDVLKNEIQLLTEKVWSERNSSNRLRFEM